MGDEIMISADFEVPPNDHGIKTPRIVNQKIAESVEVSINAKLILKELF
tara:strand:+ start:5343 stop:5489 length:147 start_codon:yes stop_codon:yes gene_type:complete